MTGRYVIYTPVESARDERRFDAAWRRFAEVCRSLHGDGLDYAVQLNLTHLKPHVLITASGTANPAKPHRQPVARGLALPMPVPAQRCRDRALEAEWFLPENRERRKDGTAYWARHQARCRELEEMAEELRRADAEYWRELETLSGQRQHFKPGLTDETRSFDDEVAGMIAMLEAVVTTDRVTLRAADAGAVRCDSAECWYCGSDASHPFTLGKRVFCCRACAADWAE